MQAFECNGVWWLPENPSDTVAGKLSFSPDGRIVVSLFGVLGDRAIRIRFDAMWPSIKKLLQMLQYNGVTVTDGGAEYEDFTNAPPSERAMDDIIRGLVKQGDMDTAEELAQKAFGMSPIEARQLIDSLLE